MIARNITVNPQLSLTEARRAYDGARPEVGVNAPSWEDAFACGVVRVVWDRVTLTDSPRRLEWRYAFVAPQLDAVANAGDLVVGVDALPSVDALLVHRAESAAVWG